MPAEEENDLSPEDLEQRAEALPDREVMLLLGAPVAPRIPVEYANLPVPNDAA
jgi:hypothetical protein